MHGLEEMYGGNVKLVKVKCKISISEFMVRYQTLLLRVKSLADGCARLLKLAVHCLTVRSVLNRVSPTNSYYPTVVSNEFLYCLCYWLNNDLAHRACMHTGIF